VGDHLGSVKCQQRPDVMHTCMCVVVRTAWNSSDDDDDDSKS